MCDQYQCRALRAVEFQHQLDDLRAGGGVEVAGGLVGEQDFWLGDEGARQRDALLFAAGEVFWQVVGAGGEPHLAQRYLGAFARVGSALQFQRQHDVFQRIQRGQQLERLEHEARRRAAQPRAPVLVQREQVVAVEQHAAAARHVQPGEQAEQGGFAGTGRAENRETLARLDRKTDLLQDGQRLASAV